MTQEEKAKAYDEALERARQFSEHPLQEDSSNIVEYIFPELKESEDERIRKAMIKGLSSCASKYWGGFEIKAAIAWLEKQGEQNTKQVSIWKHWKDGIAGNGDGGPIYLIKNGYTYSLSSCLSFECDYILLSDLDKLLSQKSEMKSAEESLGISSEEYNNIVNECLYGESNSSDKAKPKFHKGYWR